MQKQLHRSVNNKAIAGVCAGLADYFNLDPTLVRIGFILIGLLTAVVPTFLLYLVLAVIMPLGYTQQPGQGQQPSQPYDQKPYQQQPSQAMGSVFSDIGRRISDAFGDVANSMQGNRGGNQPQQPQQPPYDGRFQANYRQPQPPQSNYRGSEQLASMGQEAPMPNLPPAPAPYMQPGYQGSPELSNLGGNSGSAGGNSSNSGQQQAGYPGSYNPGGYDPQGGNRGGGNQMNSATMAQPVSGNPLLTNFLLVVGLMLIIPLALGIGAGLFRFFGHMFLSNGVIGIAILALVIWAIASNFRPRPRR